VIIKSANRCSDSNFSQRSHNMNKIPFFIKFSDESTSKQVLMEKENNSKKPDRFSNSQQIRLRFVTIKLVQERQIAFRRGYFMNIFLGQRRSVIPPLSIQTEKINFLEFCKIRESKTKKVTVDLFLQNHTVNKCYFGILQMIFKDL
jgi:hypothetical protein